MGPSVEEYQSANKLNSTAAPKSSAIEQSVGYLTDELDVLEQLVSQLHLRLSPVLSFPNPTPERDPEPESDGRLSSVVSRQAHRAAAGNSALRDLLDRLEV